MQTILRIGLVVLGTAVLGLLGCWHGPPARVQPQAIAPDAAQRALELNDANHDGFLDAKELEKAPGLMAAMKRLDRNGDGKITAEEISARLEAWKSGTYGRLAVLCRVKHDGNPLAGALVTFEPESFLGGELAAGKGTTNKLGTAIISSGTDTKDPPGMSPGFFRVRITKSGEPIPARYNTETTLGMEVAEDADEIGGNGIVYDLQY
ncbi:MAG: hypothetical protein ACLP9L_22035 [Thermoguttaceae bacterium]